MLAKPDRHPARYLAWLYSPPPQRAVLEALYAIESEIAGSLRVGLDHRVAHTRLQWWREECERCAQGHPAHPLTRQLVSAYGVPATAGSAPHPQDSPPLGGISGLADTAIWDLAAATFESRRELSAYCERWAAAMIEPAVAYAIPGASKPSWRGLGAALREIEMLADLAREAHSGRLRVPLDELERAGVETANLVNPPWPAALATLLSERHEALRAVIAESVKNLTPEEQPDLRGLLVWASLAWQLSRRAEHALPAALAPRRYHVLADAWRAWGAARGALRGKFRLK
jgi:15-cis-phytoene synthase